MTSQSPLDRLAGLGNVLRYIVFQMLPGTLGLGPHVWRVLSECHLS
jgi:hypothetical protein